MDQPFTLSRRYTFSTLTTATPININKVRVRDHWRY